MFATDRVRLRPPTPDDALNMFRLHGDPELQLITDDKPFVPRHVGQIWAQLEKQVTEPPDGETMVSLLAETVADGTFLAAAWSRASTRLAGTPTSASRCSPRRAARATGPR